MSFTEISYSEARERLPELWVQALAQREPIRLTRRDSKPVVLLDADEYEGLMETAHLLRSPANAARSLAALARARAHEGDPRPVSELRAEFSATDE